jgi:transcriptional regulator with XRE-family HTH domain
MGRFADLLIAAMDEAGVSAAELAERAGLTESAISLLRAARREPSYRTLQRLSHVFPSLGEQLTESRGPFDSIDEAIADVRAGKMVVVLDDEDRENEGDLVMAAQMVTPAAVNFMRKHAGGLICVPMVGARRTTAPRRSRGCSTPTRSPQISCGRVTPFRCEPVKAACWCARDKPRQRSISPGLPGSIRPASSARSWPTTGRWNAWKGCAPMPIATASSS